MTVAERNEQLSKALLERWKEIYERACARRGVDPKGPQGGIVADVLQIAICDAEQLLKGVSPLQERERLPLVLENELALVQLYMAGRQVIVCTDKGRALRDLSMHVLAATLDMVEEQSVVSELREKLERAVREDEG